MVTTGEARQIQGTTREKQKGIGNLEEIKIITSFSKSKKNCWLQKAT